MVSSAGVRNACVWDRMEMSRNAYKGTKETKFFTVLVIQHHSSPFQLKHPITPSPSPLSSSRTKRNETSQRNRNPYSHCMPSKPSPSKNPKSNSLASVLPVKLSLVIGSSPLSILHLFDIATASRSIRTGYSLNHCSEISQDRSSRTSSVRFRERHEVRQRKYWRKRHDLIVSI